MNQFWEQIRIEMERINPSSLAAHLDPTRPYDGQPHTTDGTRGQQLVEGLTMRDIKDCYIRALFESSGLPVEEWPNDVYQLEGLDPLAVWQNLGCNLEKMMGIFPNVPRLYPVDPTQPHWCGANLDTADWTSHEGKCP